MTITTFYFLLGIATGMLVELFFFIAVSIIEERLQNNHR